ncbi:MAG TPA: NTP transferase domain-containing protein [Allosphingosinicella sp.]|uniref:NTP transferase domain-containing protein n=1 Tax=Allosphingosinicella sp. TaxID=2823234 RepID=UPI002EDAA8F7
MIPVENIAAILLCAGSSRRHPSGCKLMRFLDGRPLVAHAATLLAELPFKNLVAVVPPEPVNEPLHRLLGELGFALAINERPEQGQDSSVRIGLAAARHSDPDAFLICLGDMPHIESAHLHALATAATAERPTASGGDNWLSPPVLFPRGYYTTLVGEDRSPRDILARDVAVVAAAPRLLTDFDLPTDFEAVGEKAA